MGAETTDRMQRLPLKQAPNDMVPYELQQYVSVRRTIGIAIPDLPVVLEGHLARKTARRTHERLPVSQAALRDHLGRLHGSVSLRHPLPLLLPLLPPGRLKTVSSHLPLASGPSPRESMFSNTNHHHASSVVRCSRFRSLLTTSFSTPCRSRQTARPSGLSKANRSLWTTAPGRRVEQVLALSSVSSSSDGCRSTSGRRR